MLPASHRSPGLPVLGILLLAGLAAGRLSSIAVPDEGTPPSTIEHFLIEGAVPADRGNGVVLNLGTATLEPDSLVLRIGFRNMGTAPIPNYGPLEESNFHLGQENSLSEIPASSFSPELHFISPPAGLLPRLSNSGTLTFPIPSTRRDLTLRVAGFAPITFSLTPESRFAPNEPGQEVSVNASAATLKSRHEHLSIFPVLISKIDLSETAITVELEFENASNRSFFLNSAGISGKDAFLVDADFKRHQPVAISDSLSQSIGPVGAKWNAGSFNAGSVSFNRPHPHAMRRLLFSFPTYESIILTFDEGSRAYESEVVAIGDPGQATTNAHPFRVSADLFSELSGFLQEITDALHETRIVDYLNFFAPDSQAREGQAPFLTGMSKVSPAAARFGLVQEQQLSLGPGGRIDDVSIFFDYSLPIDGVDHRFRSLVVCSFTKATETGAWKIDRWRFANQPPFWLVGLTELQASEHFSIFCRPGIVPRNVIVETQTQLEAAYERLQQNEHLQLEESYVAFLIDRAEDFQFLTSKNALRYHGAASTSYTAEQDRYIALNRAMFLNEASFRNGSSQAEIETRLQTITHELAHLALATDTRHFTPPWLIEGIAVNLANQLTPGSRRALIETGSLPVLSLSALSRGDLSGAHMSSQAMLNFEYIYAGEAVAYIIRTYGQKRFFDYYRSFATISPAQIDALAMEQTISSEGSPASIPKLMHQVTLELTRQQFGLSLYDLDTVIRSSITLQSP